jgi:hypothetical protein
VAKLHQASRRAPLRTAKRSRCGAGGTILRALQAVRLGRAGERGAFRRMPICFLSVPDAFAHRLGP